MKSHIETIRTRVSCRSYSDRPVDEATRRYLADVLNKNTVGPFGNPVRFHLLDLSDMERQEVKSLGTYGVIKGASLFIAGTVSRRPGALEDFGYCMEKNILMATERGLGTCWLGGTFNKSGFAKKIGVTGDELLPAITPVGYPAGKKSLVDSLFRFVASSKKRKPPHELFFDGDTATPLSLHGDEPYADPLESVRIGPSASNKQPWRIIKERDKHVFHFYLERTRGYDDPSKEIKLQDIDMGIAMCHFECAAEERGLAGRWQVMDPGISPGQWAYIASWTE